MCAGDTARVAAAARCRLRQMHVNRSVTMRGCQLPERMHEDARKYQEQLSELNAHYRLHQRPKVFLNCATAGEKSLDLVTSVLAFNTPVHEMLAVVHEHVVTALHESPQRALN